jgi:hypothetical protein
MVAPVEIMFLIKVRPTRVLEADNGAEGAEISASSTILERLHHR